MIYWGTGRERTQNEYAALLAGGWLEIHEDMVSTFGFHGRCRGLEGLVACLPETGFIHRQRS
jgi:hypothetical protein